MICRPLFLALICLLPTLALSTVQGQPGQVPGINDRDILSRMPGANYEMPPRLLTPAFVEKLKKKEVSNWFRGRADRAARWTEIPDARWRELISDFAPISMKGTNLGHGGADLFNNKPYYRGSSMTEEDFLKNPFQARTRDGGHIIYAREADMPDNYPWKPNRTVKIPHLDGTVHEYRFFVPDTPKIKNAGPEFNSARKHWLCPAGEVWRARLEIIMKHVIPELAAAVFWNDDPKAEHTLAVIMDRIAEVYPELPLVTQSIAHSIARTRDGKNYMDLKSYRSVEPELPFPNWEHKPFWFHSIYDYNYCKLNWGIPGWNDGVLAQMGMLARCIDLLKDRESVKQYSQAKYNAPDGWYKHMVTGYLEPAVKLSYAVPPTLGNTSYGFVKGAVELGLVAQDRYIFERGLSVVEMYVPNNWLYDGMALDGAFNYAAMTYGIIRYRWMNKFFGGLDLNERYPILNRADKLTNRPVVTLYNIGSKHADQHARFYRSRRPWMPPPEPDKIPYDKHQLSQCMPAYGLTCLRGGAPGSRLELILEHQNTPNHVHKSKLSLQLFYEGVELLPDFGYGVGTTDVNEKPWSEVEIGYELVGSPYPQDKWGPYRHNYTMLPEAHCLATVDHYLYDSIPTKLHGYLGGQQPDQPGYWTQFVDTGGEFLFEGRPNPVDVFRRQVAVVTLPGGRSLALDFFRISGGKQHDLFWHVPSDITDTTLEKPEPIEAETLMAYKGIRPHYEKLTGKTMQHYGRANRLITGLKRRPMPDDTWSADFLVQPSKVIPKDKTMRRNYQSWPQLLHDVNLRLWGWRKGTETATEEIIEAKGPWPGILEVYDEKTGRNIENALVGLKDAITFLIQSRVAAQPGLKSTFVHVLEPRNPEQPSVLKDVVVSDRRPMRSGGGVTATLTLNDGSTLVAASTLDGRAYRTASMQLVGRFGAAIPSKAHFTLFDGSELAAGGWSIKTQPTRRMKLVGVIGDLTGHHTESALLVETETPLPTDGTLVGRMVHVDHQAHEQFRSGYEIGRVRPWGPNRYRIDIAWTAQFIHHRLKVLKLTDDPTVIKQDFRMYKGVGWRNYDGRRIRFLDSGWETEIESASWSEVKLKEAPPEGAVKEGSPFIVYTVRPGDEVIVPSHVAVTGKQVDGALLLDVQATGPVQLTVPGGYTGATFADNKPIGDRRVRQTDDGLVIDLADGLPDGRGRLRLIKP